MKFIPRKAWRPKHSGIIEPDMTTLLMGHARELLTTWEVTQDKALINKHLKSMDKRHGEGAEARVRGYMRWVAKHERCAG